MAIPRIMKLIRKVLISLALATILFVAFAVFAYSGLFDLIDARFYRQRIQEQTDIRLRDAALTTREYQRLLLRSATMLTSNPAFQRVFLVQQTEIDIQERQIALEALLDTHPEIDFLRIIDAAREQVWFSSLPEDVVQRSESSIEFKPTEDLDPPLQLPPIEEEFHGLRWDGDRQAFHILLPLLDQQQVRRGVLSVWGSTSGLHGALVGNEHVPPSERIAITPVGAVLLHARRHSEREDLRRLDEALQDGGFMPLIADSRGDRFVVQSLPADQTQPAFALLVPESAYLMDDTLQVILLASVWIVTFLLIYLLFNVRQDPAVVVSERFRRLQESVIRDYLRAGPSVDPLLLQRELENRRPEIERELVRGTGALKGEKRLRVEQEIARGWEQIAQIVAPQRAGLAPAPLQLASDAGTVSLDTAQIEHIIERTLDRFQSTFASSPPQHTKPQELVAPADSELEEIEDAEELEELADEELEELEDLEELAEEEAVELEEVEEVEELEELADEELEELEDLEELAEEEAVELEEVEEVEELEELADEELEELEDLEELTTEDEGDTQFHAGEGWSLFKEPAPENGAPVPAWAELGEVEPTYNTSVDIDPVERITIDGIANVATHHVVEFGEFLHVATAGQKSRSPSRISKKDGGANVQSLEMLLGTPIIKVGEMSEGEEDQLLQAGARGCILTAPPYGSAEDRQRVHRQLLYCTRQWNSPVVFTVHEDESGVLRSTVALGMGDRFTREFVLPQNVDVVQTIGVKRRVGLLKRQLHEFSAFETLPSTLIPQSIQSWLIVPLENGGENGMLFVGFVRRFGDIPDLLRNRIFLGE